jgi:NADH-quinone oxidoreductase subunit G
VLGNLLDVPGFDYATSTAIRDELLALPVRNINPAPVKLDSAAAIAIKPSELDVPIYAIDALVRRADSLQQTQDSAPNWRKTA